ncbi:MAG: hypothetical protein AB7D00_13810 [Rhodospirillaceae bacterium]
MPNKLNDDRRHKFAKAKYRVTNWPELRSKFCSISNDLAKTAAATTERPMALASLENVERALARQMAARRKATGPKFG